jgi:hypothetical protein
MGPGKPGDNALSRREEERISEAVDAITMSRALIEQTKWRVPDTDSTRL